MSKKLTDNETMCATLSYISILVLVPLLGIEAKNRNKFCKFHIEQGFNLFIVIIIAAMAYVIITAIFSLIPILGIIIIAIASIIWTIFGILVLIFSILAIIRGLEKKMWKIPIISNLRMIKL